MLFGLFSQVLRVKESIFGVQKAKFWAWKKIAKKTVKRKKKLNVFKKKFGGKKSEILQTLNDERSKMNVWAKFLGENTLWDLLTVS